MTGQARSRSLIGLGLSCHMSLARQLFANCTAIKTGKPLIKTQNSSNRSAKLRSSASLSPESSWLNCAATSSSISHQHLHTPAVGRVVSKDLATFIVFASMLTLHNTCSCRIQSLALLSDRSTNHDAQFTRSVPPAPPPPLKIAWR